MGDAVIALATNVAIGKNKGRRTRLPEVWTRAWYDLNKNATPDGSNSKERKSLMG